MSRRILLDTNFLIDVAVPGRPDHDAALPIEDEVACGGADAYIAATSLKDAYLLIKQSTDAAFAREYVQCLMQLYAPAAVDAMACTEAAASDELNFEDGIVRACAEDLGVDFIISHNVNAFRRSRVRRLSPQEYVSEFLDPASIPWP